MGNVRSTETIEEDIWWTNGDRCRQPENVTTTREETSTAQIDRKAFFCDSTMDNEREQRKREMQEDLVKFKQELARKHERRRQLIVEKKKEMADLREELVKEKEEKAKLLRLLQKSRSPDEDTCDKFPKNRLGDTPLGTLREENEDLRNEVEKLKLILREKEIVTEKNRELRISLAELQKELQNLNTQVISFEKERIDYQEHVTALKDIIRVTKEMLRVRESQIEELKKKISSIEELLAAKEINILSDDLRQEYERQLRNIRDLRILYEDRQRADKHEKENLQAQIEELKKTVEDEQKKNGELTERVNELEEDNSKKYDKLVNLESNLGLAQAECKELHDEMDVINQLFSQILISFNNDQEVDLDNMIKLLEENHDLLTNIVINDESNQTSALPKVLLDLVKQVNENRKDSKDLSTNEDEEEMLPHQEKTEKLDTIKEEEETQSVGTHQLNSPEEIVENLPKVWRVLIELLSHQSPPNNDITEKKGENDNHCYKSVETPSGLRKVLSVSKTFIRLKSLILEKKSLEKEMTRLKQLNTHLEGRLSDQEKRLVLVSNELSKTWNFVGKMQKQHQQLHTQEKILRYELAQKRKLLTELKEELEYCRQKWLQARKQNSSTEEQWKQLRTEFASRKVSTADDTNNSVESGYSDDKSSSDEEDSDFNKKQHGAVETSPQPLTALDSDQNIQEGKNLINESGTETVDLISKEREDEATSSGTLHSLEAETSSLLNALASNENLPNDMSAEGDAFGNKHDLEDLPLKESEKELIKADVQLDTVTAENLSLTSTDSKTMLHSLQADASLLLLTAVDSNKNSQEGTIVESRIYENKCVAEGKDLTSKETEENHATTSLILDTDTNSITSGTLHSSQLEKTDMCERLAEDGESDKSKLSVVTQTKNKDNTFTNPCLEVPEPQFTNSNPDNLVDAGNIENVIEISSILLKNDKDCADQTDKTLLQNLFEPCASTSNQSDENIQSSSHRNPVEAAAEFAARREEKMRRLEEQCKDLYFSVAKNSLRGLVMSNKLDNLHEMYGEQQSVDAVSEQHSSGIEGPQQEEPSQDGDSTDKSNQE